MTHHILILCTHNSARSVLAEGVLNHWANKLGVAVKAHSAGSAPKEQIHPMALSTLQQVGVDTSSLRSKSWDEFTSPEAPPVSVVITVCDSAAAEACPVFFGRAGDSPIKAHWGYPDPSCAEGGEDGQRRAFELTRQALSYRMIQLLQLPIDQLSRSELETALAEIGRS